MKWLAICALVFSTATLASTTALPAVQVDPRDFRIALLGTAPSSGDIQNPGVLVGFNPQPDPPALPLSLDLGNNLLPAVQTPTNGERAFHFLFALGNLPDPGLRWSFVLASSPGPGQFAFDALLGGSSTLHVVARASHSDGGRLDPGSLVGFNPQPDPPGFTAIGFDLVFAPPLALNSFAIVGDIAPTATIEFQVTDANGAAYGFTAVPLPNPLGVSGLAMLGLALCRRRSRLAQTRTG
jgi:hypothetical protein